MNRMLLIPCPWCGPRGEHEFRNGGEAEKYRPSSVAPSDNNEWHAYIYEQNNTKGWVRERWWHKHGCERWFKLDRNTRSHEIHEVIESEQWL